LEKTKALQKISTIAGSAKIARSESQKQISLPHGAVGTTMLTMNEQKASN